ncbi:hypothetical protein ANO14919_067780 [Xylariales sp. No.14919]|nr:hypothetical protein ANO14919_067780 [Xylariales sp. No.14919]
MAASLLGALCVGGLCMLSISCLCWPCPVCVPTATYCDLVRIMKFAVPYVSGRAPCSNI